jgi:glycogen operon protein
MTIGPFDAQPGNREEGGVTILPEGVSFCVFSRFATHLELLLFEREDSTAPFQVIPLNPKINRTFFFWHVLVEGLPAGTWYCWRADGPRDTARTGCRFDPQKALLDPWATSVSDLLWEREAARRPGDNTARAMRAQVLPDDYDWEDDQPLHIPLHEAVIYELHLSGFTRHPSSGTAHPGTFSALIEKIPYLASLGITHVELMPIMAFDAQDVPPQTAALGLTNYWGYCTHSFYAPHPGYSVDPCRARDELRDMIKALHRDGIGVILDVVFNHTAEGDADGPVISFKGLGNEIFYHLDPLDRRRYRDYTGCGNTVNCNHPLVTRFIIGSLQYWVREMHVDGFRFDLASALARGEDGSPQYHAPILWSTELSPALGRSHIIAEAWDASGLYQVGDFPGFRWAEWNGRYRDVIRGFVRGDSGLVAEVATRIAGSSDLYEPHGRLPINSVNFVTCHDGFTLHDLVSYERKHNQANGEANRDGNDHNLSANGGLEGETDDPETLALRRRRAMGFVAILMLSQGVPLLLCGDEVLRTQGGNNNAYCQDNALSWLDWGLTERNRDMLELTRAMIALRHRHPTLRRERFLTGEPDEGQDLPDVRWHGRELDRPGWDDPQARALAFTLGGVLADEPPLHVILNMEAGDATFALPDLPGRRWHLAVDTAAQPPFHPPGSQPPVEASRYRAQASSVVVLEGLAVGT